MYIKLIVIFVKMIFLFLFLNLILQWIKNHQQLHIIFPKCFFIIVLYNNDSFIRTKSAGTDFNKSTNGRFINLENSLIWKYRPGTNVSGLMNHHCIFVIVTYICLYRLGKRFAKGLRGTKLLCFKTVTLGSCQLINIWYNTYFKMYHKKFNVQR